MQRNPPIDEEAIDNLEFYAQMEFDTTDTNRDKKSFENISLADSEASIENIQTTSHHYKKLGIHKSVHKPKVACTQTFSTGSAFKCEPCRFATGDCAVFDKHLHNSLQF